MGKAKHVKKSRLRLFLSRRRIPILSGAAVTVVAAGATWWFMSTAVEAQFPAANTPPATSAAPTTTATADSHLLSTPSALPTSTEQVVNVKALGFLTNLMRAGVDVANHEQHVVMVAEALCNRGSDEAWLGGSSDLQSDRENAVRVFFPDWTPAMATSFVEAAHHYCHSRAGDTHETGHGK